MLSELDQKLMEAATYSVTVQTDHEEHERMYQAKLKDVQERQKDGKGGRRTQLSQDSMDVDEPPPDGLKLRNRKYVSFSLVLLALAQCYHRPATDANLKQSQRKRNRV